MTGPISAARYLTIVPLPGGGALHDGPGAAAAWFPVIGLGIGAVLAGVDRLGTAWLGALLAAVLTVTAWKLVTGGLHLDGLADCLDGLAGRDPGQRLAIMHDSRVGAFGVIGLVLVLLLDVAAVNAIEPGRRAGALLLAPVAGRGMSPIVGRVFPSAGAGHGARFRDELGSVAPALAAVITLLVAVLTLGVSGAIALLIVVAVAVACGAFMTRRLGGVTGDVHGAVIELSEVVVLLTVAAAHPAR